MQPIITSLYLSLKTRKSIRNFQIKAINQEQLSYLLWVSTGIQRQEEGFAYRTAPSTGALYPIETYLVVLRIDSFEAGVYHYDIQHHHLDQLKKGDYGNAITQAALDQDF